MVMPQRSRSSFFHSNPGLTDFPVGSRSFGILTWSYQASGALTEHHQNPARPSQTLPPTCQIIEGKPKEACEAPGGARGRLKLDRRLKRLKSRATGSGLGPAEYGAPCKPRRPPPSFNEPVRAVDLSVRGGDR